jgi:hypothetical protein
MPRSVFSTVESLERDLNDVVSERLSGWTSLARQLYMMALCCVGIRCFWIRQTSHGDAG